MNDDEGEADSVLKRPQPLSYATRPPHKGGSVMVALAWIAGAILSGFFGILFVIISLGNFLDDRPFRRGEAVAWGVVWAVVGLCAILVSVKCVMEARSALIGRTPKGTWWR